MLPKLRFVFRKISINSWEISRNTNLVKFCEITKAKIFAATLIETYGIIIASTVFAF